MADAPLTKLPTPTPPSPAPVAPGAPPPAPSSPPRAEPPRLNAPFCAPGGDEKVTIRFTLGRALHEELQRRLGQPLTTESAALQALVMGKPPAAEQFAQALGNAERAPAQP